MIFAVWLQTELDKRGWNPYDLARQTKASGYKISRSQLSHVLKKTREAGPEACIAIAHALGLSREEVFRARGWLLREPEKVVPPNTSPHAAEVIRELTGLPLERQEIVSEALSVQLKVIAQITEENDAKAALDASEEIQENPLPRLPKSAESLLPFLVQLEHLPKPVQRETLETMQGHLTTTLKMHQRVEWLSDWFQQEFPERYAEIEAQLSATYDEDEPEVVADQPLKKAA